MGAIRIAGSTAWVYLGILPFGDAVWYNVRMKNERIGRKIILMTAFACVIAASACAADHLNGSQDPAGSAGRMSEAKHKNNDRAIAQNRPVASVSGRLFVHSFLIYSAPKAGTFFARAFCRTDSGAGGQLFCFGRQKIDRCGL